MGRRFAHSVAFGLLLALFAATPVVGQAPVYDVRAEFIYQAPNLYVVQIRNVGPTIPVPTRTEFHLIFPAGVKIVSWILNGWQCSPGLPRKGPVDIHCKVSLPGAWAAGTILSNQLFFVSAKAPTPVCVRSLLFINNGLAAETSRTNNSKCV